MEQLMWFWVQVDHVTGNANSLISSVLCVSIQHNVVMVTVI